MKLLTLDSHTIIANVHVFLGARLYRLFLDSGRQNIRVSRIRDAHHRAVKELSAGCSHGRVVPGIVMHLRFGKHGHVLYLRLSQMWAVGGNKDHLGLALSKCLHCVFVSQNSLSGFHDQLEATVHGVLGLFLHSGETKIA